MICFKLPHFWFSHLKLTNTILNLFFFLWGEIHCQVGFWDFQLPVCFCTSSLGLNSLFMNPGNHWQWNFGNRHCATPLLWHCHSSSTGNNRMTVQVGKARCQRAMVGVAGFLPGAPCPVGVGTRWNPWNSGFSLCTPKADLSNLYKRLGRMSIAIEPHPAYYFWFCSALRREKKSKGRWVSCACCCLLVCSSYQLGYLSN